MDQNNNSNNNIDLSKEFDKPEPIPGPQPQQDLNQINQSEARTKSKIANCLMKYSGGIIKSEKQANLLMILYVIFAIVVIFFVLYSGGFFRGKPTPSAIPNEDIIPAQ
jgi:hypothetical protein